MKHTGHRRFWPLYLFIILAAVFITFQSTYLFVNDKWKNKVTDMIMTDKTAISENISSLDGIVKSKSVSTFDSDSLLDGTISGYTSGINDRFAMYMNPDRYNDYIIGTSGQNSTGIGVSVLYDSTVDGVYVVNVYDDSPAQKSGIIPGDIITHVNNIPVSQYGFYGAVLKLGSGESNTRVTLRIKKGDGTSNDITASRDYVSTSPVHGSMVGDTTGLIRISEFSADCYDSFTAVLQDLISSGADRYILDVRNNPGGNVDQIVKILDFLLPDGTLFTRTDKDGAATPYTSDVNEFTPPICVLVNKNTVCGAELFASAIHDFGKGQLIGEATYGKATSQEINPLPNGGAVILSTFLYTPHSGSSFDGTGLTPDVIVHQSDSQSDTNDYQLSRAAEVIAQADAAPNEQ